MNLIQITEGEHYMVHYDPKKELYRLSFFQDGHWQDEIWFSALAGKVEDPTQVITQEREDGTYMELFAVKKGIRYNAIILNLKDAINVLINSLLDGVERWWTQS